MNKIKKIFSTALAFFIVLGTVAGDMSVVNAQDSRDDIVILNTDKKEISVGDMITINATVNIPDDANIISYEWASDKEDVAIVSANDNVASVEAKATGKAKISVVVNYEVKIIKEDSEVADEEDEVVKKTATAEVELTVQEKEEKITAVESTKEADVEEVTDTTLDPVTEQYIKDHIDPAYAKAEKSELCNAILIKQTLADADKLKTGETIDSVMAREDFAEVIYTMITASSALYNTDDNSAYYVGYANTMQKDKSASVKDVIFALYDIEGHILNDCHYDMNTGLVYIPKSYLNKNGKEELMKVQVQFLQAITKDVDDLTSKVQLTTTEDDDVKTGSKNVGILDLETNVKTETGLSKSEMTVAVNGIPLKEGAYSYNSKTGIVSIPSSSCSIQSVSVDIQEKSVASKVVDRLFDIQEVNAAMNDAFGQPLQSAGTVKLPDGAQANSTYTVNMRVIYKDDINEVYSNLVAPYGFVNDGPGGIDLTNKIYYQGGEVTSPIVAEPRDINLAVDVNGFWNYSATSGKSSIVPLRCCHISNPMGTNNGEDKVRPVFIRILNKNNGEALIGFMTPQVYGQTGAAFIKFDVLPEKGNLNITKINGNPELTAGNDCYSLKGAEYQLKSGNTVVATLTTDENGQASATNINAGNYTLVETKASKGFELNTERTSVTINGGKTTTLNGTGCLVETPANDPVAIQIQKNDIEEGDSLPQGNATLEGAEFTVKYYNALYDKVSDLPDTPTRTWVVKTRKLSNGKYIAMLGDKYKVAGDDFYYQDGAITMPIGTITIQETKAPEGYLIEGATLADKDGNISKIDNGVFITQITQEGNIAHVVAGNYPVVSDVVKKQPVEIYKTGMYQDNHGAGVIKGLNGVEFTIKLKSEVEEKGWDSAETYDVVTTEDNEDEEGGYATTKELPYGTYLMRETKTPEGYIPSDDITFTIKKDGGIKRINVNNDYIYDYVRIVKKDKVTGKKVSLNSASFRIKNLKTNEYVTQLVGNTKYSIFSTNSKNQVIVDASYLSKDDALGTVITPLMLPYGQYQVEELQAPDGFLQLEQPVKFVIDSVNLDDQGTPMVEVVVENEQPTAEININKSIVAWDRVDKNFVDTSDLSGIQFELIAKTEVQDDIDGSVIYKEGETVGTYSLKSDGTLSIGNLPIDRRGTTYIIKEVKTLDGLVLNDKEYKYEFKQKDLSTKVYKHTFDVKNDTTKVEVSKRSVTGQDELKGATLTVSEKDGNIVDEWVSGDQTHHIQGLKVGETYTLTEKITPDGYVKATSIDFKVANDGTVQKVDMIDKIVAMTKTDVTGEKEVEGATIVVTEKETEDVVDTWVSDKDPHFISGLEEGKTYVLTETIAPEGYVKAESIEFTVTDEKVDQQVIMKDKRVEFTKTDVTGEKEVEGATITVTDKETGKVVDTWTSTKDKHFINGLEEGRTYILSETVTPEGYVKAESIEFTVTDEKVDQQVIMKDKRVEFTKTDVTGEKEVEGATIVVTEKETEDIVDTWVSDKDPHYISGLEEGKTYVLTETIAPEGYVKAESIEFTVTKEKVNQKINMKDKVVTISKQDAGGEEVEGAKIQIIDEDGNIVDEWISTNEPHHASGLEEGKTYTLHEDLAPNGYNVANDFEFEVTYDKVNQVVEMIDTIVKVSKTNEQGQLLKGAELEVVSAKTKQIVDQWTTGQHIFDITDDMKSELREGNTVSDMIISEDDSSTLYKITPNKDSDDYTLMLQANGQTDYYNIDIEGNETTHMIQGLISGGKYFLRETKAPEGYATAPEQEFTVDADDDITLNMVDEITKIVLHKQDITTKQELAGASLKVTEKETGKVVDEWISGTTPHLIEGLSVGKTYIMTEVIAPKNYKMAESIEFTVTDTGVAQQVYMYDELLPVKIKTGDNTKDGLMLIAMNIISLIGLFFLGKTKKEVDL